MNASAHQFRRRTFLRGVGVSMALPWLESLAVWGDEAKGKASEAPVRLAVLFSGNGLVITATAVTLEPGSAGDVIKVRNTDSGRVFSGIVMADGTVRVGAS